MVGAACISFSPLKSIKVPLVVDKTADLVEPPSGRSPRWPSPLKSERERERARPSWTALPTGSLYPNRHDSVALYVPIPTRLTYRPNLRPPPKIGINSSANYPIDIHDGANTDRRKVILSRQLLIDDTVIFIIGTKSGGSRDTNEEVPLSRILNHVSLAELQRFENQEFLEEDIHEANQPPSKPKGRPVGSRLVDGKLILASNDPKSQISRTGLTSSPGTPLIAVRVPAFVPSSSRPQPTLARRAPVTDRPSETSEDELSYRPARRPQYAMVTASRLAPSETSLEGETSRDVSASASRQLSPKTSHSYHSEQSPKRRRLDTQLPLRAASPTKTFSSKDTLFDRIFKQPQSSTSLLNGQLNRLPSIWSESAPSLVPPQPQPQITTSSPSPQSAFPPGFDRGRYPLLRRRRKNKNFTPTPSRASSDRVSASDPRSLPTSSSHTVQGSYNSPTKNELEDVEMVDEVEDRNEEAEREALLRQFQPLDNHREGPPMPPEKLRLKTPSLLPDAVSISTQEASVLAQDMLDNFQSRTHVPSIQVTTPSKSLPKRSSITPHFPLGAKVSTNGSLDDKAFAERSPSKSGPAPVIKTISIKRPVSPELSRSARDGTTRPPTNLSKPAQTSFKTHRKLSLYPTTNGSSNKRQRRSPTPNDITKYFRPKSTPAKPPSSPPEAARGSVNNESDTDSEDPLARTAHERPNPHSSLSQCRAPRNGPNPNLARNQPPKHKNNQPTSDSDSDTSSNSLNSTILHVQPGRPYTIPPQAPTQLQSTITSQNPTTTTGSIVPDSEDDQGSQNNLNDDDELLSVSEREGSLQRRYQLSNQLRVAGVVRALDREMDLDLDSEEGDGSDFSSYDIDTQSHVNANNTQTSDSQIPISIPTSSPRSSSQHQHQRPPQEVVELSSGSKNDSA